MKKDKFASTAESISIGQVKDMALCMIWCNKQKTDKNEDRLIYEAELVG